MYTCVTHEARLRHEIIPDLRDLNFAKSSLDLSWQTLRSLTFSSVVDFAHDKKPYNSATGLSEDSDSL
jgi:hypothetical protein